MLTRRLLIRRVRHLVSPSPCPSPSQSLWSRPLTTDSVSLPHENDPSTLNQLVKEGAINQNVANYFAEQRSRKLHEKLLSHPTNPGYTLPSSISEVTLETLLASQSHLGHATSLWNPANARYIFGIRDGIHIISLDQTAAHLRRAAKIVRAVSAHAGIILFVGTRKGQEKSVVGAAERSEGYHLFDRWIPGGLTNGKSILGHGQLKVVDQLDREIEGFEEQLVDHKAIKPDLVVVLNPLENYPLLRECAQHNIPTIGVIDTNVNPGWVTYQIPANDDSLRCTSLIAHVLGIAAEEGRNDRLEKANTGDIPFDITHKLVMPEEFEAITERETEEVIDLRPDKGVTSVRFAKSDQKGQ